MSASIYALMAALAVPGDGGDAGFAVSGPDQLVTTLTDDSRSVVPGALFAALPGRQAEGGAFIAAALQAGAVAVLDDGRHPWPDVGLRPVTRVIHPRPRQALARLAAAFYGHPAREMQLVGITGTNGKTTVAAMVESILAAAGGKVGVIGTTGMRWPDSYQAGEGAQVWRPNPMTTPDPIRLHRTLREIAAAGCRQVVMEVSSHALDQDRVAGLSFQVAVFTHLTRDHLDYHGTFDAYFRAKCRLFEPGVALQAVLNHRDPYGLRLGERIGTALPVTWFQGGEPGFGERSSRLHWGGTELDMVTPEGPLSCRLQVVGRFNIANALAAAAAAWQMGCTLSDLRRGLAALPPVDGRMQALRAGQPFGVVVDYAHTPDALVQLINTARELTAGRVIALFGCGGERDVGKRSLMGAAAGGGADLCIITDDNPRSEDPAAIREAVIAGCRRAGGRFREIPDRREAIGVALALAQPGDAVLIAGKGHESVQVTAQGSVPFDDRAEALAVLMGGRIPQSFGAA